MFLWPHDYSSSSNREKIASKANKKWWNYVRCASVLKIEKQKHANTYPIKYQDSIKFHRKKDGFKEQTNKKCAWINTFAQKKVSSIKRIEWFLMTKLFRAFFAFKLNSFCRQNHALCYLLICPFFASTATKAIRCRWYQKQRCKLSRSNEIRKKNQRQQQK